MQYISLEIVNNIIKLADVAHPKVNDSLIVVGAELSLEDIETDQRSLQSLAQAIEDLDVNEITELCDLISLGSNNRTGLNILTPEEITECKKAYIREISDLRPLGEYLKKALLKIK
jgi:hypothetical protein